MIAAVAVAVAAVVAAVAVAVAAVVAAVAVVVTIYNNVMIEGEDPPVKCLLVINPMNTKCRPSYKSA